MIAVRRITGIDDGLITPTTWPTPAARSHQAVLEGEDAIARYRALMGDTNPGKAAPGTLRKDFGQSIEANAVHGSDSANNAAIEIALFFESGERAG